MGLHIGRHAEKVQASAVQGLQKGPCEEVVRVKSQRGRPSVGEGCVERDMGVRCWGVLGRV